MELRQTKFGLAITLELVLIADAAVEEEGNSSRASDRQVVQNEDTTDVVRLDLAKDSGGTTELDRQVHVLVELARQQGLRAVRYARRSTVGTRTSVVQVELLVVDHLEPTRVRQVAEALRIRVRWSDGSMKEVRRGESKTVVLTINEQDQTCQVRLHVVGQQSACRHPHAEPDPEALDPDLLPDALTRASTLRNRVERLHDRAAEPGRGGDRIECLYVVPLQLGLEGTQGPIEAPIDAFVPGVTRDYNVRRNKHHLLLLSSSELVACLALGSHVYRVL